MKKRFLPLLLVFAIMLSAVSILPGGVRAAEPEHLCDNEENCTVCIAARLINALPDADDITIENAAAVTEQLHAIDRVKVELDTENYDEKGMCEYDYLLTLVDNERPSSGYGVNVPTRYIEALNAINSLAGGGSVYVTKVFQTESEQLDWEKTNAVFSIECVDKDSSFEPLSVTLADIAESSLTGFYSAESNGWTNKYILPAGTYKITETGYSAITADNRSLATTATYVANGAESEDYALVTVEDGEDCIVTVLNSRYEPNMQVVIKDESGNSIAATLIMKNDYNEYQFSDNTPQKVDATFPYRFSLANIPEGYIAPDLSEIEYYVGDSISEEGFCVDNTNYNSLLITVTLKAEPTAELDIVAIDSITLEKIEGVDFSLLDNQDNKVEEWTSTATPHTLKLKYNSEYTLISNEPEYFTRTDDSPIVISVDESGRITAENVTDNTLTVEFTELSYYYVPLLSNTITYGDPLGGKIIDMNNITCNGEPYYNQYIGQAFYLEFVDENGNVFDSRQGTLPVGTYTVSGKEYPVESGQLQTSFFTFGEPITVKVLPLELTEDMFKVTAENKAYDGTTKADLTVEIAKEDPASGTQGIQIKSFIARSFVYDDVTAVIEGEFENSEAGENKKINYTVTALEGADAFNYALPEEGISGTVTASILHATGGAVNNDEADNDKDIDEKEEAPAPPKTDDSVSVTALASLMAVSAAVLLFVSRKKAKQN